MTKRLIGCAALSCVFAAAQTKPVAPGAEGIARTILAEIAAAQTTNRAILKELGKTPPSVASATPLAQEAARQAKAIRAGIEALDQHYDQLPEPRQSALRRAWSIAVLMNSCAESARDSALQSEAQQRAGEMRTGTECALRRARQLEETLAPFQERGGS